VGIWDCYLGTSGFPLFWIFLPIEELLLGYWIKPSQPLGVAEFYHEFSSEPALCLLLTPRKGGAVWTSFGLLSCGLFTPLSSRDMIMREEIGVKIRRRRSQELAYR